MDSELLEVKTAGEPVVVVVNTPEPVSFRTPFEFFGGIFIAVIALVVLLALMALVAAVSVIVAAAYLVYQIILGYRLDRQIAARMRALRAVSR